MERRKGRDDVSMHFLLSLPVHGWTKLVAPAGGDIWTRLLRIEERRSHELREDIWGRVE